MWEIAGGIGTLLGLWFVGLGASLTRRHLRWKARLLSVEGQVEGTGTARNRHGQEFIFPEIGYQTPDGRKHRYASGLQLYRMSATWAEGSRIELLYDPTMPHMAYEPDRLNTYAIGARLLLAAGSVELLASAAMIASAWF